MNTEEAYNRWSTQYDIQINPTRDLEARALRQVLEGISFGSCLEIGCGTGKNTQWLAGKTAKLTGVDLSTEMLARAREKVRLPHVQFVVADITSPWSLPVYPYDLVSFSLVLEHIADLDHVFREAVRYLSPGGHVYLGELHPFKQYAGSKARFETETGTQVVPCFDHHLSDFTGAARKAGLTLLSVQEHFDGPGREGLPRILTLLWKKNADPNN